MSSSSVNNVKLQSNDWPILLERKNPIKNAKTVWRIGSRFVVPAVGIFSKIWTDFMNKSNIYNHHVFLDTLSKHYNAAKNKKKPLITISNHSSCMDDPLIWGSLIPFKWHLNSNRLRWSAAAQEICFSKGWHSAFFSLGRTFPIVRGKGIYQPAMDYATELLKEGSWIHFFPQGKVVVKPEKQLSNCDQTVKYSNDKKSYELKWGVARLIIDHVFGENNSNEIDILPFYHIGMETVLPSKKPYIPRINQTITYYIRDEGPIHINKQFLLDLINDFNHSSSKTKRIKLMQFIENEMNLLKEKCLSCHNVVNTITN